MVCNSVECADHLVTVIIYIVTRYSSDLGPQIPTFLMTSQDGILGVGVSIIGQKWEDSGPKNAGEECYQQRFARHSTCMSA